MTLCLRTHVGSAVGQWRSVADAVAKAAAKEISAAGACTHAAATRRAACGTTSGRTGAVDDRRGEFAASFDVQCVDRRRSRGVYRIADVAATALHWCRGADTNCHCH